MTSILDHMKRIIQKPAYMTLATLFLNGCYFFSHQEQNDDPLIFTGKDSLEMRVKGYHRMNGLVGDTAVIQFLAKNHELNKKHMLQYNYLNQNQDKIIRVEGYVFEYDENKQFASGYCLVDTNADFRADTSYTLSKPPSK